MSITKNRYSIQALSDESVRDKARKVKNWKSSSDQVMRWAAISLTEAEKKFRAVKGIQRSKYTGRKFRIIDYQ